MKSRFIMYLVVVAFVFGSISSCGKANGLAPANVDCGYRFIAGHDCIVCDHGGVSCKWD